MIVVLSSDTFGQNVLYNRILQGLSIDELAEKAGISREELEGIESGFQLEMNEIVLITLSRTLDIPLNELMGEV